MAEIFDVVDENDNVIGQATREECHSDKSKIHRVVAILVFKGDKVYLQKRSSNKNLYPGLLTCSASGHVDSGETYDQAAKRELKEELGIEGELKKEFKDFIVRECETHFFTLYSIKYDGELKPDEDEIAELPLLSVDEIKKMMGEKPELFTDSLLFLLKKYLKQND